MPSIDIRSLATKKQVGSDAACQCLSWTQFMFCGILHFLTTAMNVSFCVVTGVSDMLWCFHTASWGSAMEHKRSWHTSFRQLQVRSDAACRCLACTPFMFCGVLHFLTTAMNVSFCVVTGVSDMLWCFHTASWGSAMEHRRSWHTSFRQLQVCSDAACQCLSWSQFMFCGVLHFLSTAMNVSFCAVTAVSDMLCGQVLLRFQMPSGWHWSAGARKKSAVMPHVSA